MNSYVLAGPGRQRQQRQGALHSQGATSGVVGHLRAGARGLWGGRGGEGSACAPGNGGCCPSRAVWPPGWGGREKGSASLVPARGQARLPPLRAVPSAGCWASSCGVVLQHPHLKNEMTRFLGSESRL